MYKDEALRIALEGLERSMEAGMMTGIKVDQAIAALRQALEQPAQAKFFYGQDPNVLPPFNKGKIHE